jgi:hypothetical protein
MGNIVTQIERNANEEIQVRSEEGVDLTLIRWMLSLSPRERLLMLQQNIRSITRLKRARRNL